MSMVDLLQLLLHFLVRFFMASSLNALTIADKRPKNAGYVASGCKHQCTAFAKLLSSCHKDVDQNAVSDRAHSVFMLEFETTLAAAPSSLAPTVLALRSVCFPSPHQTLVTSPSGPTLGSCPYQPSLP